MGFGFGKDTNVERTFVMLKPDALQRGLSGEIIRRLEGKGYRIQKAETLRLDSALLRKHYSHVADQPFYPDMEAYMTSGPVLAMIIEGKDVIRGVRMLMGATRFEEALPGTIRGDLAGSTTKNLIHGADSPENAETEIRRFFGEGKA